MLNNERQALYEKVANAKVPLSRFDHVPIEDFDLGRYARKYNTALFILTGMLSFVGVCIAALTYAGSWSLLSMKTLVATIPLLGAPIPVLVIGFVVGALIGKCISVLFKRINNGKVHALEVARRAILQQEHDNIACVTSPRDSISSARSPAVPPNPSEKSVQDIIFDLSRWHLPISTTGSQRAALIDKIKTLDPQAQDSPDDIEAVKKYVEQVGERDFIYQIELVKAMCTSSCFKHFGGESFPLSKFESGGSVGPQEIKDQLVKV